MDDATVDVNISLLDVMQGWVRCAFLSDFRDLSDEQSYIARETGMDRTTSQKYYDEVRAELAVPANI